MSNISIISSILFSIDKVEYKKINFIFQSATYKVLYKQTAQGYFLEHFLEFSVARITPENEALLRQFKQAKFIKVTDVNGLKISLVNNTRFIFEIEKDIQGSAGAFRGYKVKVIQNTKC